MSVALGSPVRRFGLVLVVLASVALWGASQASADISFTRAWGWGVNNGTNQLQTCSSSCQTGLGGSGAGQVVGPNDVAYDAGDVYVADGNNNRIDEFSASGAFIVSFGTFGGGAGDLNFPEGVTTGSGGNVYVADHGNNRISEFSSGGTYIRSWGISGGGAGELEFPDGIDSDNSGNLYVADEGNNRVDEFSSTGAFIKAWGWGVSDGAAKFETCTSGCQPGIAGASTGQLNSPNGVAINGGNVYVGDTDNDRIEEFSTSGTFIRSWGWGVANGAGQFETCTTNCEAGLSGAGGGELDGPVGVSADGTGDVYVADGDGINNRVDEFSATGAFIEAWGWGVADGADKFETCTSGCEIGLLGGGAGQFDGPVGVAADNSGDVFIADSSNNRIDEFAGAGGNAFALTVTNGGSGSGTVTSADSEINCGSACSFDYASGAHTTLTATPAAGSTFTGWAGGGCSGTGTCTVTLDADQNVTATFTATATTYNLSVANSGPGSGTVTSGDGNIDCGTACSFNYTSGTQVTLTATPALGSAFGGWSGGGCSGTGPCTVTMNAAASVIATFNTNYLLRVTDTGSGSGTVTSGDGDINCGVTCSFLYPSGTPVTLTAVPSVDSSFTGWSGACTGTGTCTVTMDQAQDVMAGFATLTFNLTVADAGTGTGTVTSGDGNISCGTACSFEYPTGSPVTLTAVPAAGSAFAGWSGGGCSGTGACDVTMNALQSVTATFVPTYTLTVTNAGSGSGTVTSADSNINCGSTCAFDYASGAQVTLTATPATGSTFEGWSGAGCSGTGACVVTMSAVQGVTATFNPTPPSTFNLAVADSGSGSGTVTSGDGDISCGSSCSFDYPTGTQTTLTATPASGSSFAGWSGACSGTSTCTLTMSAARTVTAAFTKDPTTTAASLSSSANPVQTGQAMAFTATITPVPTSGTVAFTDNGTTLPGCGAIGVTAMGRAVCNVLYGGAGSHSIQASYTGSATFTASRTPMLTEIAVGPHQQAPTGTATTIGSSARSSVVGQQVILTAAVSPAPNGGSVSFTANGATVPGCGAVAVSAAGQASCHATFGATGTYGVDAAYTGTSSYTSSQSSILQQSVRPNVTQIGSPSEVGGVVKARLKCAAQSSGCRVRVVLVTTEKLHLGKVVGVSAGATAHGRRVTVGTKSLTIVAGKTVKVSITLNGTGRKLLHKFKHLLFKLNVS